MADWKLVLPHDFDEYGWEVESKGYFGEARLICSGRHYRLNFYDPARLAQEITDDLQRGACFFEPNLVVIPSVTRSDMEHAAEHLAQSNEPRLVAEPLSDRTAS